VKFHSQPSRAPFVKGMLEILMH